MGENVGGRVREGEKETKGRKPFLDGFEIIGLRISTKKSNSMRVSKSNCFSN